MFDFIRELVKSAEIKQQEAMNAYLDDALTPVQRRRFEQQMADEPALREQVRQLSSIKQQLRQLPARPVPRNFMLDPAVYGRPQRQPLLQLYPAMRLATVLTAFLFIVAVATNLFVEQGTMSLSPSGSGDVAMLAEQAAEAPEAAADEVGIPVERESEDSPASEPVVEVVVEQEVVVEEAAAPAEGEAAAEEPVAGSETEPVPAEPAAASVEAAEEAGQLESEDRAAAPASTATAFGLVIEPTPPAAPTGAPAATASPPPAATTGGAIPTATLPATGQATPEAEAAGRTAIAELPTGAARQEEGEPGAAADVTPQADSRSERPSSRPLFTIQLVLGAIVLVLVVATLLTRRRYPF